MSESSSAFKLQIANHIATLSFNIPQKANALDEAAWEEMRQILYDLSQNSEVRVVILAGEGKHFCAGIDLETLMQQQANPETDPAKKNLKLRRFILKLQDCITGFERCNKPVIAAVHNACIGAGVDIIAACDMRYCTTDANFSIKEIDLGLVADLGTLQRLPTIINPGHLSELAFTGRKFLGPEAKSIGLVNDCYATKEEMMTAVTTLAKTMAEKSPLVLSGIKESLLYKRDHSVKESLEQIATYNAGMLVSEDIAEAFSAHLAKRKADYRDF